MRGKCSHIYATFHHLIVADMRTLGYLPRAEVLKRAHILLPTGSSGEARGDRPVAAQNRGQTWPVPRDGTHSIEEKETSSFEQFMSERKCSHIYATFHRLLARRHAHTWALAVSRSTHTSTHINTNRGQWRSPGRLTHPCTKLWISVGSSKRWCTNGRSISSKEEKKMKTDKLS